MSASVRSSAGASTVAAPVATALRATLLQKIGWQFYEFIAIRASGAVVAVV
jgi:hypothetical protein